MQESEAKYLLEDGKSPGRAFRRALQELAWAGFLVRPLGKARIRDTYFDTRDWQLQAAGWSLRVRLRDSTYRLTCKALGKGVTGIFEREELEQAIPANPAGEPLEVDDLEGGPVTERLRSLLPAESMLEPLFTVKTRRRRYQLASGLNPETSIELAMDRTRIRASIPAQFTEIEAELKEGPMEMLHLVASVLQHQPGLVESRVSKYQRGLLAAGCAPEASPGAASALTVTSPWVDLGLEHIRQQTEQLRQFEPLAWEGAHVEGVHQLRVATRRLRAALRTFSDVFPATESAALATDLRWLAQTLGVVRDLDVHLLRVDQYRRLTVPEDQQLLNDYQRNLRTARRRAHRHLRTALDSTRFQKLRGALRGLHDHVENCKESLPALSIEQRSRAYVPRLLKKVLQRGRRITRESPAERLHRLRIDVKRLRYQLEFLEAPYGKPLLDATRRLRRLQNTLGDHQDAQVARDHLESYRLHNELGKRENRVFKLLLDVEDNKAARNHHRFFKDWKRFEEEAAELRRLFR